MNTWLVPGVPVWAAWIYGAVACVAAVTDFRSGKIYNWLTLPALVSGLLISSAIGGVEGLGESLKGLGIASAIFIPLFAARVLGAGDAKLMMAFGTVLGVEGILELISLTFLIAGLGAFALLIVHRRVKPFFKELYKFFRSLIVPGLDAQLPRLSRSIKAPFGIPIFLAFLVMIVREMP
ncbi:MAG: prepilin peptidase [Bdellovibrionota bacterium]